MNKKALIICCLSVVILTAGCIPKEKYEKYVNLTAPAGEAESFSAKTHNGKIVVNGSETSECNITAKITGAAMTQEKAKELAEQVKIELLPEGKIIKVNIERPKTTGTVYTAVDLDVNLPAGMNLSLESHNGKICSSGVTGMIQAVNHNGKITVTDAVGGADLETHNGKINYTGKLADLRFKSHNGGIDIQCTGQSEKPCTISAETHNGSIELITPENFSAAVDASTHNGLIHSDLPITITKKTDNNLEGTIGEGRDKLHMETHNGSIKIK
ncbi:MAG: DUF4097 family beta strand repeat protein [Sedimentisphaerales bacterium]|nr:DUF4097 family beta strand repeat protein [Sedimentisphaerales bacterium]